MLVFDRWALPEGPKDDERLVLLVVSLQTRCWSNAVSECVLYHYYAMMQVKPLFGNTGEGLLAPGCTHKHKDS